MPYNLHPFSTPSLILSLHMLCACHQEAPPPQKEAAVDVIATTIEKKTIPAVYEYVGFARSSHEVEVRARVAGYLNSIDYNEGQFVSNDQLLFQIDPRPFEAALNSSKGDLAKQEAVLWDAKRSVERLKPLYEQKAASRRDLDTAISQEAGSKANVDSGKANLVQAELNLAYTTIRSPVDGLAGASNFRVGALIITNESLLTTISVIDPIWINFSIPERDILQSNGERLKGTLKFPENEDFTIEAILADGSVLPNAGKVNFFSPTYDPKTGTMMARAELPNPDGTLRPGQFIRARITGAVRPDAIVIPQRAVVQSKKGLYVYTVNKENRAVITYVDAGEWVGDQWIIKSGLKTGDVVIADGINKIQAGSLVHITSFINNLHNTKSQESSAASNFK
ncbi:MAG: efflux RND transporter periplasmic adaptor subunit [Parachlamydiaceae bacterium]|nr:efflux RND transporter periplasmic adaptor subunit [Parachlamydiaceae bacterium]